MAYTTITAATIGLADGDQTPTLVNGTVRITPRFPAAATTSGLMATGPVIVEVTGGAMPKTDVPAQADATALVEFHLYDPNIGPVRLPNTEIPLEPNTTINLRDYLPAGIDPQTGWGIAKGEDGAGITDITSINGELVIKWEGGRSASFDFPDAVQGVGVSDATAPAAGSVAFVLTDGSTTSSIDLPPGPKGQDGSNVLPARTAIVSEAEQPDFVRLAQSRSPYDRMTLTATSGGGFLVRCFSGPAAGADNVAYQITAGPRYRLIGTVTEHSLERGGGYVPDPTDTLSVEPGDVRIEDGDVTTTGTWTKGSTWYTTEEGATWEATITTTSPGDEVFMSFYFDNRGGMWKIELVEDPTVTANFSVFRASGGTDANHRIFSVPNPGTYTLRGTFLGADPANPPSGGTARGWLINPSGSPVYYQARVATFTLTGGALSDGASNKSWALRAMHPEVGGEEFMPWHGQDVETIVTQPEFYDRGRKINTGSLATGDTIEVGDLSMVQHIKCHNSASPDELIDVHTIDTILPNGTYQSNGRIEVLHDLISTDQMYTGMLPFNPSELNRVVTSRRTTYPAGPGMASGGSTKVGDDDGLHSTSVAVVGDDPNVLAAVRFNAPDETRRLSVSNNAGDPTNVPMFIDHRSETLGKVYPRFGYVDGTLVHVGTVWRFSVDYWFGRAPGIRWLVE